MWSTKVLGTDIYHLVAAFVVYSILGWLVESIYMSFCNRKITNRGFAKSPFCPIYGFGALGGYYILVQLKTSCVAVYFAGAVVATIFEFLVGVAMIKLLGQLWWDYNEKPFNYKGIICLESTIAWGFYALGIVYFLHDFVLKTVDRVNYTVGVHIIMTVLTIVIVDYIIQLLHVFHVDMKEKRDNIKERCLAFFAK